MRLFGIIICCLFIPLAGIAQSNLDAEAYLKSLKSRLEKRDLEIRGQLTTSMKANFVSGIDRRSDPFNFRLNGRLLVSYLGFNTSINFNYANGGKYYSIDLPNIELPSFARIGVSPRYKWAKLHLGFRSMSFSRYTLAGHSFLGAGIELTPGNFHFSAMYGQLKRARAEDLTKRQNLDPAFKRLGWGIKAGYRKDQDEIAVILFSAKDDPLSIPVPLEREDILPAENTVLSLQGKKHFGSVVQLDVDYALSAFTRDATAPKLERQTGISLLERMGGLFDPRISSGYHKALKTDLSFKTKFGRLVLGHELVDPDYRSLGALFFQNDFENLTVGINTSLAKKKLMLMAKLGWQRNNLSSLESNASSRLISSIDLKYNHDESLNFGVRFSNFRTTNRLRATDIPVPILVDSIFLALVNQSLGASFSLTKGPEKNKILIGNFNYQRSNTIMNEVVDTNQTNRNLFANISYSHTFLSSYTAISASVLLNSNASLQNEVTSLTPTIALTKGFFERRMSLGLSASFVNMFQNGTYANSIFQPSLNVNFKIDDKKSLRFYSSFVARDSKQMQFSGRDFNEFVARLDFTMKL